MIQRSQPSALTHPLWGSAASGCLLHEAPQLQPACHNRSDPTGAQNSPVQCRTLFEFWTCACLSADSGAGV